MKTRFLIRNGSRGLLVFFNGWSRDAADAAGLRSGCDVLEVHDYSDLDPVSLFRSMGSYHELHLAAWSLGVWAAACVFENSGIRFETALALNGTLCPVHPEFGIAPEIFDGTIANWLLPAARERFLRRMAGSAEAAQRLPDPERSPEDQQTELTAIRDISSARTVPADLYTRAVSGRRDRIIPFAAQEKFWRTRPETAFAAVDLPHYPFGGLSSWEEVFRLGNA
ncbi:MAG: DUF452 family protein [Lentisphaeria bacterium]|nr:DUF452 family protein [Lentisphaeria bacterium]